MNEEIEQAMASLKHLVECRCDEGYTGRGRHDPYSACDYAEEVKIVADHVAAIEAKLTKAVEALQDIFEKPRSADLTYAELISEMNKEAREALAEISSEAALNKGETE